MVAVIALLALFVAACSAGDKENPMEAKMTIQLTSTAFAEGQPIPHKYTCDGSDVSPPLAWTDAAANTKSFALIADDPDAPMGTWVHWVIYNLPPDTTALAEDTPKLDSLPNGAKQGLNDFKNTGYNGPCPPPGKPHRYFFKLYALDAQLNLPSGLTKKQLLKAMDGHILAQGQLMGTYQRQ